MLSLFGWSCFADSVDETITMNFKDSHVREMTLIELKKRNIWYEINEDNQTEVFRKNMEDIVKIYTPIMNSVLSPGRSVNYNLTLHAEFVKRLDANNIPYRIVQYGDLEAPSNNEVRRNLDWVVWEKEQDEKVMKVRESIEKDLIDSGSILK